ncbi:TPA: hypothetical protein T7L01_000166 [Streptococcus suis]|nr:hypothetical protein [Streptococcus suis]NQN71343.1 hypothetical protein [Streptococcus suis]NQN75217.1 hypothetical protein [Streptococcus suis]NQN77679.1 hypothetical protein [Streptococcus suis]HEL2684097.1 hypothetical protein [Streptococcus suis]
MIKTTYTLLISAFSLIEYEKKYQNFDMFDQLKKITRRLDMKNSPDFYPITLDDFSETSIKDEDKAIIFDFIKQNQNSLDEYEDSFDIFVQLAPREI